MCASFRMPRSSRISRGTVACSRGSPCVCTRASPRRVLRGASRRSAVTLAIAPDTRLPQRVRSLRPRQQRVTTPRSLSTVTSSPSIKLDVAFATATTARSANSGDNRRMRQHAAGVGDDCTRPSKHHHPGSGRRRTHRYLTRSQGVPLVGRLDHSDPPAVWKILHQGIHYEERGPAVSAEAKKVRARKMIRELRSLGYRVEFISPSPTA